MGTDWLFNFEVYPHHVPPCLGVSVSGQLVPLWRTQPHLWLREKR